MILSHLTPRPVEDRKRSIAPQAPPDNDHHKTLENYEKRWKKRDISACDGLLKFLDLQYEKPIYTITEHDTSYDVVVRSIIRVGQDVFDGIENCLEDMLIDIKIFGLGEKGGIQMKVGIIYAEFMKMHKKAVYTPYMNNMVHFNKYSMENLKLALRRDSISKKDVDLINRVFICIYCMKEHPPSLEFRIGYASDSAEREQYYCLEAIGIDDVITQSFIQHLKTQISPRFVSWSFLNHPSDLNHFTVTITTDANVVSIYNKVSTENHRKRKADDA